MGQSIPATAKFAPGIDTVEKALGFDGTMWLYPGGPISQGGGSDAHHESVRIDADTHGR
jgi:hypothetical protein